MRNLIAMSCAAALLSGCYEKTPSKEKAVDLAKQEISMAMCGNRSGDCINQSIGSAKIGERLSDNTNKITVTFSGIVQTDNSPSKAQLISSGIVNFTFDAKNGNSYINEISLWSDDHKNSIDLCGHDYIFCRK